MDGNAQTDVSNRKNLGMFCGEIEQTRTFISETSFVKIIFNVNNFTEETYFSFDSRVELQKEVSEAGREAPLIHMEGRNMWLAGSRNYLKRMSVNVSVIYLHW